MPLSEPGNDLNRPAEQRGLFSPLCASCGKDRLKTTSGKHSSANAGYCPSCGVFIGFECARKAGWMEWKRLCPSCGKRLRTNTLLMFGVIGGVSFLLVAMMLVPMGIERIQEGNAERLQAEMPVADPGKVHPGETVKVAGTVAGTRERPITAAYSTSWRNQAFVWDAYDFDLNCTNGMVRVRGSILSGTSPSTGQIIGSDGDKGSYSVGDRVVVLGVVSSVSPQIVVEPSRIAPNSAAFDRGRAVTGWWMVGFGLLYLPVFVGSLWELVGRYRSHRRRAGDFAVGETARPLESIDQVKAVEARDSIPGHREDVVHFSAGGTTVEELEKRIRPYQ